MGRGDSGKEKCSGGVLFFGQEALALESKLVEQMKALQDVNESDSAGSSMHGGLMSWINDAMPWWPDVVD